MHSCALLFPWNTRGSVTVFPHLSHHAPRAPPPSITRLLLKISSDNSRLPTTPVSSGSRGIIWNLPQLSQLSQLSQLPQLSHCPVPISHHKTQRASSAHPPWERRDPFTCTHTPTHTHTQDAESWETLDLRPHSKTTRKQWHSGHVTPTRLTCPNIWIFVPPPHRVTLSCIPWLMPKSFTTASWIPELRCWCWKENNKPGKVPDRALTANSWRTREICPFCSWKLEENQGNRYCALSNACKLLEYKFAKYITL